MYWFPRSPAIPPSRATANTSKNRAVAGKVGVDVDGTIWSGGMAPVSVGPTLAVPKETKNRAAWEDHGSFVFAYKVSKVWVKKGTVQDEDHRRGAMLGAEDEEIKDTPIEVVREESDPQQESFVKESTNQPRNGMSKKLDRALKQIANLVTLLWDLKITFEVATRDLPNLRVAKEFYIPDEEGNRMDQFLQDIFFNHIRDRFPNAREFVWERIPRSILLRRKIILYGISKHGEDTNQPPQVTPQRANVFPKRTRK
ncbi:hypothetical protein E4U54_008772 [Claviceps lovelessii]|nr:hypothetical protein E4U54_008772 [Claviceps lovelessii]